LSKHDQSLVDMHLSAHWIARTREVSRSPESADNLEATRTELGSASLAKLLDA
jgi:hypothetical protein